MGQKLGSQIEMGYCKEETIAFFLVLCGSQKAITTFYKNRFLGEISLGNTTEFSLHFYFGNL